MNRRIFAIPARLMAACIVMLALSLCACEHFELADADQEDNGSTTVNGSDDGATDFPYATGLGTRQCPYTPGQLLSDITTHQQQDNTCGNLLGSALEGTEVCLMGYAVGEAYRSISNATFTAPFGHQSNILLASDSLCTDATLCIPVELSTEKQKSAIALANNSALQRQCLLIEGTLYKYLNVIGLRNITAHRWFPGQTLPDALQSWWDEGLHQY